MEGWWLWLPITLWGKAHMCPISNLTVRSFVVAFFPDSCSCVGDVDQLQIVEPGLGNQVIIFTDC